MSKKVFNAYSRYYDLLYSDKDYAGEATYIQNLLSRFGVSKGELLEFGSGTGKHAKLLVARGYTVHGIELSAEMVAKAETVPGFTCQQGDIACTTMCHRYDAVLSLFHVISYQTSDAQLQGVFSNAALHLKPDGLFIFDFWYTPAVYAQKPVVRIKRMNDGQMKITRIAEPVNHPNENRVDVNYTIYARDVSTGAAENMHETHSMRHFSLPEIRILARMHGFEVLTSEEFLTGGNPGESTWGVCVVLKKTQI
jgi:SAM-dependent methyltransferase